MDRRKLEDFFQKHQDMIMDSWFDAILNNYPPETVRIFKQEKDPFANPVGHRLRLGMRGIVDWFKEGDREKDVYAALDQVIRIWAVQDFTPSQTVSFLITFKQIIQKQMQKYYQNQDQLWANWQAFEKEADNLMLLAMDIYMECREKLFQIKVDEANNRVFSLLRQANMMADVGENFSASSVDCGSCNSCETEKKEGCKNEFTS
jgi:hypothetical protein